MYESACMCACNSGSAPFGLAGLVIQLRSLKSDPKCKTGALAQFRLHHCTCTCVRLAAFVPLPGPGEGLCNVRAPDTHFGSDFPEHNCTSK